MGDLCRDLGACPVDSVGYRLEIGDCLIVDPDLIGKYPTLFFDRHVGHRGHPNTALR